MASEKEGTKKKSTIKENNASIPNEAPPKKEDSKKNGEINQNNPKVLEKKDTNGHQDIREKEELRKQEEAKRKKETEEEEKAKKDEEIKAKKKDFIDENRTGLSYVSFVGIFSVLFLSLLDLEKYETSNLIMVAYFILFYNFINIVVGFFAGFFYMHGCSMDHPEHELKKMNDKGDGLSLLQQWIFVASILLYLYISNRIIFGGALVVLVVLILFLITYRIQYEDKRSDSMFFGLIGKTGSYVFNLKENFNKIFVLILMISMIFVPIISCLSVQIVIIFVNLLLYIGSRVSSLSNSSWKHYLHSNDINMITRDLRGQKVVILDVDGVLTRKGVVLAFELVKKIKEEIIKKRLDKNNRLKTEWEAFKELELNMNKMNYDEMMNKFCEIYAQITKDISLKEIELCAKAVINKTFPLDDEVLKQDKACIHNLQDIKNFKIVLLSGSPTEIIQCLLNKLNIKDCIGIGNSYMLSLRNKYKGKTANLILDSQGKKKVVEAIGPKNIELAVGDSMGDYEVLRLAHRGLAFYPSDTLAKTIEWEHLDWTIYPPPENPEIPDPNLSDAIQWIFGKRKKSEHNTPQ